jgi:hypothetical protein
MRGAYEVDAGCVFNLPKYLPTEENEISKNKKTTPLRGGFCDPAGLLMRSRLSPF